MWLKNESRCWVSLSDGKLLLYDKIVALICHSADVFFFSFVINFLLGIIYSTYV